jgi:hypothetical protein
MGQPALKKLKLTQLELLVKKIGLNMFQVWQTSKK